MTDRDRRKVIQSAFDKAASRASSLLEKIERTQSVADLQQDLVSAVIDIQSALETCKSSPTATPFENTSTHVGDVCLTYAMIRMCKCCCASGCRVYSTTRESLLVIVSKW
jgi:hypothetical protein